MSKDMDLTASMQDYLETILELEGDTKSARITDIANKLNIAKPSVNQAINKFKELGLAIQQTYGPVELTEKGRKIANKVIQKHKKLRQFLVEVLNVDLEIAERDACLMEHIVSPQTMDRLTDFLCKNGYITDDCPTKE